MPILNLLIKPASGSCNMRCRYCFYADEGKNREQATYGIMSEETMHAMVDRAMKFADRECMMMFQGGEPTLAGLSFFRSLVEYLSAHPNPKNIRVRYAIQTNGYVIDKEWAAFLAKHRFLVGISLDGGKEVHDRYRVDVQGKGTYNRVMSTIRLLEKYRVEYNILTVVTATTARSGRKIYEFFKKNGFGWQQYIECLDPIGEIPGNQEFSLTPQRLEQFLKDVFDAWYLDWKSGRYVYNRYFENLLMILNRQMPENCSMRGTCGKQWVVEADGSVYPCDFYALDEWKLGNLNTDDFEQMDKMRETLGFIKWSEQVPDECRTCSWYGLCRNGCRRNREPVTAQSTNVNYFCSAYKHFFEYAYPRLFEIWRISVSGRR